MPVAPPREHPLWLRIPLNLSGPLGIGLALLGILNIALGVVFTVIGVLYVAWEVYPSAHGFVKRRPTMSLAVFLVGGLAVGFFTWWFMLKTATPKDVSAPLVGERASEATPKRLEFLQRRADRIQRGVHFMLKLDRAYYPEELGAFKMVMTAFPRNSVLWVAAYGPPTIIAEYKGKKLTNASQNVVWLLTENDSYTLQDTTLGWDYSNTSRPSAVFMPNENTPLQTIGAFEGVSLGFWVNKELVAKIVHLVVWADDYVLLALPRDCVDSTNAYQPMWPEAMPKQLKDEWSKEEWLQIVPRRFRRDTPRPLSTGFPLSFNDYTPMLVRDFESTKGNRALTIPPYEFCDSGRSN